MSNFLLADQIQNIHSLPLQYPPERSYMDMPHHKLVHNQSSTAVLHICEAVLPPFHVHAAHCVQSGKPLPVLILTQVHEHHLDIQALQNTVVHSK